MNKEIIKKIIWRLRGVRYENGAILEYDKYLKKNGERKIALLSYLTKPFLSFSKQIPHNNWGLARNIVKTLNQSGFVVDIIDLHDKNFVPAKKYDLFIGHGGINFEVIEKNLSADCLKIYFATGLYWKFHNEQGVKRIKEASEKKGIAFETSRQINEPEESALKKSDAIIALGGEFSKKTYAAFPSVYTLDNFFHPDKKFDIKKKNFAEAKNNFLFLSGSGNIHKGLDLALEAFVQMPEKNLFICTKLEDDFAKAYKKELFETKNIHYLGFLKENSEELRKIMYNCGYLVHPSCSEGSPGAVIMAMFYGLTPIISQESNVNVGHAGYQLASNTVEEIIRIVRAASDQTYNYKRAAEITEYAKNNFSERIFMEKLKNHLNSILAK